MGQVRLVPVISSGGQLPLATAILLLGRPTLWTQAHGPMSAVAMDLEAKEGEADAVAEILRVLTPPTMAKPAAKLFLPVGYQEDQCDTR